MKEKQTLKKEEKQVKRKKIIKAVYGVLIGVMIAIAGITIIGAINQNCKTANAETKQAREGDNRQWEEYPKEWTQTLPWLKIGENYNKVDPDETFLIEGTLDLEVPIIFYIEYIWAGEARKEILEAKKYIAYKTEEEEEDNWYEISFRKDDSDDEYHIRLVFNKLQELTHIYITPYGGNKSGDEEEIPANGKCYIVEMEADPATGNESEKVKSILWEISYSSIYEVWYDKGLEVSYQTGYENGYDKGYSEASKTTFNPIGMIIEPVATFFNTPMFGEFSIGSFFVVALFVSVAIIFLKIFAGG